MTDTPQRSEPDPPLIDFYRSYIAWLDAGAPDGEPYHRNGGLCHSLRQWYLRVEESATAGLGVYRHLLHRDLLGLAPIESMFPFGSTDYHRRHRDCTMHLCPKREDFVRTRIRVHDKKQEYLSLMAVLVLLT
jgi:hypothetical protein